MSALDTWFLHVEDDVNHMHIGSIGVFEGPPPSRDELRGAIAAALPDIPRTLQRYRQVAGGMVRPVWVDDPHFDLEHHVRHTALPRPGGDAELRRLVGRVMGQQLDRRRPLWEVWFVEGLADDRWAMVSKVHHSVVDGIAGLDLLATVLRPTPDGAPADGGHGSGATAAPRSGPTQTRRGVVGTVAHQVTAAPGRVVRTATTLSRRPAAVVATIGATVRGSSELAGNVRRMPPSSLTGPIGPHRRYATAEGSLDDVKAVKRALGGTVNDVVLAAVTAGYRDLLAARGELSATSVVRTMVPVSTRPTDQRGAVHNLVSAVFVPLPVGTDDPVERYRVVRDTTAELKRSGEHLTTAALVGSTALIPTAVLGVGLRTATWLLDRHQRFITSVTTNVPGPTEARYLAGRRLLHVYPYVPIAEGLRTGVAIFSYDGQVTFGVTADFGEVPDVDVLAEGIDRGLQELIALVR